MRNNLISNKILLSITLCIILISQNVNAYMLRNDTVYRSIFDAYMDIQNSSERGADIQHYKHTLETAVNRTKIRISLETYNMKKEPVTQGKTVLYMAASLGYYPLVEVMLKDKRFLHMLNIKDNHGYTPLDAARMRRKLVNPFLNPTLKHDVSKLTSYKASRSFYGGELAPYKKTIALLTKYGAESTCKLNDCYQKNILEVINKINGTFNELRNDEEEYQRLVNAKREAEENLRFLRNNVSVSDEKLVEIVQQRWMK